MHLKFYFGHDPALTNGWVSNHDKILCASDLHNAPHPLVMYM